MFSMNPDHGGHESDFRQDVSDSAADPEALVRALLETLGPASHWEPALLQAVTRALGLGTEDIEEDVRQKYEYESIPAQDRDGHELPNTAQADGVPFKDPQSPAMLETDVQCLPYPMDVSLQLPPNEAPLEHTLHLQVSETAKMLTVKELFS